MKQETLNKGNVLRGYLEKAQAKVKAIEAGLADPKNGFELILRPIRSVSTGSMYDGQINTSTTTSEDGPGKATALDPKDQFYIDARASETMYDEGVVMAVVDVVLAKYKGRVADLQAQLDNLQDEPEAIPPIAEIPAVLNVAPSMQEKIAADIKAGAIYDPTFKEDGTLAGVVLRGVSQ